MRVYQIFASFLSLFFNRKKSAIKQGGDLHLKNSIITKKSGKVGSHACNALKKKLRTVIYHYHIQRTTAFKLSFSGEKSFQFYLPILT